MSKAITIETSKPPYSESAKSWNILVIKGRTAGSWSTAYWFPKKVCQYDVENGLLTMPVWLYDKVVEAVGDKLTVINK